MTYEPTPVKDGADNQGRPPDARALFIGIAGALLVVLLIMRWTGPDSAEADLAVPVVQVRKLVASDVRTTIAGTGIVRAQTTVGIVSEVAGKVVFVHSELQSGGVIGAGEKILQIDPRDFELAVQQAEAAVAAAQVELDIQRARAGLAEGQWRAGYLETEPDLPSALLELQIRQARARLEGAETELARAKLNLERTAISLPYRVLVTDEDVDLGQYVAVGQDLAAVCGIDAFEITVAIDANDMAWPDVLDSLIPSSGMAFGEDALSTADVRTAFTGHEQRWAGYVSRTTGQIDAVSQAIEVVVTVPNPSKTVEHQPLLLPGAAVEVRFGGKILKDAVAVPREAIRDDNSVWLFEGGLVRIQPLDIAWRDDRFVYVTSGVSDKALIITSALDGAIEGRPVEIDSAGSSDAD